MALENGKSHEQIDGGSIAWGIWNGKWFATSNGNEKHICNCHLMRKRMFAIIKETDSVLDLCWNREHLVSSRRTYVFENVDVHCKCLQGFRGVHRFLHYQEKGV